MKKTLRIFAICLMLSITFGSIPTFADNYIKLNSLEDIEEIDLFELTLEDLPDIQSIHSSNSSGNLELIAIKQQISNAYINIETLKEYDKEGNYVNKLAVLDINTISEVIKQERLNDEEANRLIQTWVENDNFGKSIVPEYDFLLPEPPTEDISREIMPMAYSGEPKLVGKASDTSGVHYIVKSEYGYNKTTGYLTLPTVTLKSSTSDPDVPYGHFGIYTLGETIGLDLGTYYKQSDGKWRFFISGYAKRPDSNYTPYYKEIQNVAYTPNQINKLYFIVEAVKGSSYDTYRLTAINGSNWATIGTSTVSTNETGYGGEPAPNISHLNSNYSNVRMHREVTLAHAKQANRQLSGTTIVGATWSDVYIYSPSTTVTWGTSQTSTVERVGQTTAYANTVKYSIKTKWSEDTVDILYK